MPQRIDGLRRLLGLPAIYGAFQRSIGTESGRRLLVDHYLALTPDTRLLDVGCANGRFLDVLPPLDYVGFDPSEKYIDAAREVYGQRGEFLVGSAASIDRSRLGEFSAVVARGVLHHLDDTEVVAVARLAAEVLSPGGMLVSLDPCRCEPQRQIARFLVDHDRGQNVRSPGEYRALIASVFASTSVDVHHDLLRVPYDHAVVVATAPSASGVETE